MSVVRRACTRLAVGVVASASVVALGPTVPAAAATTDPPVTLPTSPRGLASPVAAPSELDPVPRYQPQTSCQPYEQKGVTRFRTLVMSTYGIGRSGRTVGPCTEGVSEHAEGRAWDWMVDVTVPRERAAAADLLAWLTQDGGRNARRLGVMYVIYDAKIWGAYRAADGWRPSSGHADHVHVSFSWNGARGATSFWTGRVMALDHGSCRVFAGQPGVLTTGPVATACPTPATLARWTSHAVRPLGSRAAEVMTAQARLGVARTGVVDTATRTALKTYQLAHDLPWTGVLDQPTWTSIDPASVTTSATRGMDVAGARAYGQRTYGAATMRRGHAGKAVLVLQKALNVPLADMSGYFGPVLQRRVVQVQAQLGRPQSGTWTGADWDALVRMR